MSNQRPEAGYRGALPPRQDRLAGPWVVIVVVLFVLMFALSFVGLPSALIPDPTPVPTINPSIPAASAAPTGS